ncbi:glycosyltransferase family 4 protein [Paenibacillus sp. ATY16]|uniref:glycosyltransferase family 4 protein n=1 Tax=Paenibacillus sp. ATY16 TaxID=1759312 RepID=UPI0020106ADE|nr:glycosyltransferase family 4 protein [Paenibacillus sp. ATY16]MCK9861963.1 glycosyltransferase family 4 protein [Paenibacillus sp. ATY16]
MEKVLFVHNHYQLSGGEDTVVSQELNLLNSNGIHSEVYSVSNDMINDKNLLQKAMLAINTTWSKAEYVALKRKLISMKPDVVHVHNFFPLISPSVYYACNNLKIPVVQTLHNYRIICPSGMFLREGKVCEKCLKGSLINSVLNGCYRDSIFQTIPVAAMIKVNRMLGTWAKKVDKFISLTDFARNKFIEAGIPEDLIVTKPNFITSMRDTQEREINTTKYLLFVGRVSLEKGVETLLEAWSGMVEKSNYKLCIIGDGPEKERLEQLYSTDNSVVFLGKQEKESVLEYMQNSMYLIVPSLWYEGFPMTIIESYSMGTPVLASRIGSLQEVVVSGETGLHFNPGDIEDMRTVLLMAINYRDHEYEKLREKVSLIYQKNYTAEVNLKFITEIYNNVIEGKRNEYLT